MGDKMTEAQWNMLKWLSTTDLEVEIPAVADRLVTKGYATKKHDASTGETYFAITEAGRRALAGREG